MLPLLLASFLIVGCEGAGEEGPETETGVAAALVSDGGNLGGSAGARSFQTGGSAPLDIHRIGYERGSPDAPIKVVEISDFGCGYCRVFNQEIFPTLLEEYVETGKVQWKFVPYVLGIFPNGDKAALAGECAADQGVDAFFRMRDRLFADQAGWRDTPDPDAFFIGLAREERLRERPFARCLEERARAPQVAINQRLGAALAVRGTPAFVIDGLPASGALPVEAFRRVFDLLLAEDSRPSRDWLPPPPTAGAPSLESLVLGMGLGYSVGPEGAPVQVIEFSDFGCGYCRAFQEQTRPVLEAEYVATGRVRWTYVPFVLGSFPNGDMAAVAGECAGEQGRFDPVRLRLYRDQSGWRNAQDPKPFLAQVAGEEGLDVEAFETCLTGSAAAGRVAENTRVGRTGGVRGTPAFFVNGFPVSGALPLEAFRDLLDLELSTAADGSNRR